MLEVRGRKEALVAGDWEVYKYVKCQVKASDSWQPRVREKSEGSVRQSQISCFKVLCDAMSR